MLVLERREGESIKLGKNTEIKITNIDGKRGKVGTNAPKELIIERIVSKERKRVSQTS
ncbi:MAG: carbon storage regulator [Gammaproteobacteria bacterium]